MSAPRFTNADKLAAVERELGYRRRVYPRQIDQGRMRSENAARQIAVFEAIAAEYREKVDAEKSEGRLI